MNSAALSPSNRTYVFVVGALVVLALAFGLFALFAHASVGPTVNTVTTNSSNTIVTSAVIGTNVFEGALVATSTASTSPTGTVTFSTFAGQTCTGTPTVQSGVALVNGMASSSATTVGSAGISYLVNYNGDSNNLPSIGSCTAVAPTSATVSITNTLSATNVNAGSTVTDHSTLAGNTGAATGTVAYRVFTDSGCTLGTTSATSVNVTGGIVPTSGAVIFNQAGNYYWQSVYSGDNANTAATSSCTLLTVVPVTTPVPPVATSTLGTPGSISGTVFSDTNNNRVLDTGEAGIAGVTIQLSILQNNWWLSLIHIKKYVPLTTTTTDTNGNYTFSNLAAGVYQVQEVQQPDSGDKNKGFQPVALLSGAGVTGLNFANRGNANSTNDGKGHDKNDNSDNNDNNNNDNESNEDNGNQFASSTQMIHIKGDINANFHSILKGDNGKHGGEGKGNGKDD